jgi:hypothetical protein
MLVNLTPNWKEIERRKSIAEEHKFEYLPQCDEKLMQYGVGIYQLASAVMSNALKTILQILKPCQEHL